MSQLLPKRQVIYGGGRGGGKHSARMEELRCISPRAHELISRLPLEYQKTITLFFPIEGGEPFVGVEINGKGMQPADPVSYGVCQELLRMLWDENPNYLRWGMGMAQRQRREVPKRDGNPEDLIDAEFTERPVNVATRDRDPRA